jgi:GH25 family lysozyme M1 (1,4-beta-N-acetylmuramidase)
MIRVGYRGYETGDLLLDSYAQENYRNAKAAGLKVGAYFFSQATSVREALEEAVFFLHAIRDWALDMPVVYDWEYVNDTARTADVNRRMLTDCTLAFCARVSMANYRPMIYFNTSQARDMLFMEELVDYPWWLAKYDLTTDFLCRTDLWQYTNQGSIPGIAVAVDINQTGDHRSALQVDGLLRDFPGQHRTEAAILYLKPTDAKLKIRTKYSGIFVKHSSSPKKTNYSLFPDLRQAGRGHGLTHTAGLLVRQHHLHIFTQPGEFLRQHPLAGGKNGISALAGHDPA